MAVLLPKETINRFRYTKHLWTIKCKYSVVSNDAKTEYD